MTNEENAKQIADSSQLPQVVELVADLREEQLPGLESGFHPTPLLGRLFIGRMPEHTPDGHSSVMVMGTQTIDGKELVHATSKKPLLVTIQLPAKEFRQCAEYIHTVDLFKRAESLPEEKLDSILEDQRIALGYAADQMKKFIAEEIPEDEKEKITRFAMNHLALKWMVDFLVSNKSFQANDGGALEALAQAEKPPEKKTA